MTTDTEKVSNLEDYSEEALEKELIRRKKCRDEGICDYCGRIINAIPSCRMFFRHKGRKK